jgi:hypothetical protein
VRWILTAVLVLWAAGCGPRLSFEPVGPLGDGSTDRFEYADLELAYSNTVRAAQIYEGRRIEVTGNVRTVTSGAVYLECGTDCCVSLSLPRENLVLLSKGQQVSYECTLHRGVSVTRLSLNFRRCTPTLEQIRQSLPD